MISLIAFIFTLSILVLVHELGHFLAARSVGAKVEKFYIGFNPWGFGKVLYQGKETEYGIGFLPLGGYCKIAGMVDESLDSKDSNNEPKDNEFRAKNTFQKLWILSAGVIMNFLLAILIFSVMTFHYGIAEPITEEPIIGSIIENHYNFEGKVIKKSAAYEFGLQSGDKIIQIDEQTINTWDDLSSSIRPKLNEVIDIKWIRDNIILSGSIKTDTTVAVVNYKLETIGVIGIGREISIREVGIFESLYQGFEMMNDFLIRMIFALYGLITGEVSFKDLSGPIGIAQIAGDSAKAGIGNLFYLIAILSINLGLVNILPIPGLDGGHVFITLIEGVLGKELSLNVKMSIQQVGILILFSLFILIIVNDISKLL